MGIDITQDISEIPFLFFDTETTGLNPNNGDRITEMGAVKILDGKVISEFNELINPECDIPEHITRITGITNDDVKNAKKFRDVFPGFLEIAKDCVIVAHNVDFDKKFLYHEMDLMGYHGRWQWLDTWKISKVAWPGLANYRLQSIAEKLGIDPDNAHRALDDAITCSKVFFTAIKKIKNRMSLKRLIAIEGSVI